MWAHLTRKFGFNKLVSSMLKSLLDSRTKTWSAGWLTFDERLDGALES
jgi:hypothetical protein